ncbi:MAG TPA: LuxR C-terminal-related transcriptional regulator [Gaiellaceae bacterium]|nr:LuxR C-terminal-related transcriptional regulator [Gaiellaceae bacterium]
MPRASATGPLESGRLAHDRRAWAEAHEQLTRAGAASPLGAGDLELLATAAYMLGRDDEYVSVLERAHRAHVEDGEPLAAARSAFWLGLQLALRGEVGGATGWFGRAQRLVDRAGRDCVEQGYLVLVDAQMHAQSADWETAAATARESAGIAERHGDADLLALALMDQGHCLLRLGRVDDGLKLLDEAMVAVTAGELSPIVTGLVYCSVIDGCHEASEPRRAREWTTALTRWCARQPEMVSFTGRCLVHRSEIMQLHGSWEDALEEATKAAARPGMSRAGVGQAHYRQGEILRLRGQLAEAEEAFRRASAHGREPQPGLALLRLAQGSEDAAAAAMRRAVGEASDPIERAALLPAFVEVLLAAGEIDEAERAAEELEGIAAGSEGGALPAAAAHARGAVSLARGDAGSALRALRRAERIWGDLEAPYESACVRALVGRACIDLGDEDSAALELEAARRTFEDLGAASDLARLGEPHLERHGLTDRELEVLRLVAAGRSNREIAAALVISEHTVARHVQNIFGKLGVSSRTAAGAFAYEHGLT